MRQKLTQWAATSLLLLTCLLSGRSVFAQETKLSGRVTAGGMVLPGVTIQVKGTHRTVQTDEDGQYIIKASQGSVLVFSYVGYTTQEMPVTGSPKLDVALQVSGQQLHEVVVTALGITKDARRVGYAMTEVKGDALTKSRDADAFSGLEGKVAGMTIASSPELLGRPMIIMRGSENTLFVVDGVPISSDTWNINGDDVESYTVLKGANASALYGFRGANGAIIITTKKGSHTQKGWAVNFNTSEMIESGYLAVAQNQAIYGRGSGYAYSYTNGLTSGETLYDNGQRLPVWGPQFSPSLLVAQYNSPYDASTGVRTPTPWVAAGTNNLKNFLQPGILSSNNISMSTGGQNYSARVSYSHVYQKGMAPNTGINMDYLNLNITADITSRISFEGKVNANFQYTPNTPDVDYGPNSYVYMFNVYGPDDYNVKDLQNYYQGPMGVKGIMQYNENYGRTNNPYFMAYQWMHSHYKTDVFGYVKLNYKITPDLSAFVRTSGTAWNQTRSERVPASTVLNVYLPWYYFGWYGDYRVDHRELMENNTDALLSYNKQLSGGLRIGASVGGSIRSYRYASEYATTQDLAVPGVYSLSNSINPNYNFSYNARMQVYSGYYSVDLGYKNYVNLSATGRVDDLSTLPVTNSTFFYPSFSASTSLTDWLRLPSVISFFKLRASYANVKGGLTTAQMGSAVMTSPYGSLGNLLGYGSEYMTAYDGPSYTNQNSYATNSYYNNQPAVSYSTVAANSNLKPFSISSYEGGVDYRMFNNRLGFDATYFQTYSGPLIYQASAPPSSGFLYQNVNGLTSLKKGWELALTLSPFRNPKGFSWDLDLNWSTYKETLYKLYAGSGPYLILNGHEFTKGERLDDYYSTGWVLGPNGQHVLSSSGAPLSPGSSITDNVFLGHLNPDFTTGIVNHFSYKKLSLTFQFDGRVGGKFYDDEYYHMMNGGTAMESVEGALGVARNEEWESTAGGTKAPTPAYIPQGVVITSGTPTFVNGQISNMKALNFAPAGAAQAQTVQSWLSSTLGSNVNQYYMISRTFFKLREVNLAYDLTSAFARKGVIKSASVSLIGRNLLYFAQRKDVDIDQYGEGFDIGAGGNTAATQWGTGDVTLSSPTARWFGVNFNMGF